MDTRAPTLAATLPSAMDAAALAVTRSERTLLGEILTMNTGIAYRRPAASGLGRALRHDALLIAEMRPPLLVSRAERIGIELPMNAARAPASIHASWLLTPTRTDPQALAVHPPSGDFRVEVVRIS